MAELILGSKKQGLLEVNVVTRESLQCVELRCNFESNREILDSSEYEQLKELVNTLDANERDGRIYLVARLLLS
jgi:hypothetical protein